jgi:hypothetical protein
VVLKACALLTCTHNQVDETLAAKVAASASAPEPEKLGEVGMAKLKLTIASILQPEETVLRALKRLGTRQALADTTLKAQFESLTECASTLMANGEYEVYSDTKRVFERDAGWLIPNRLLERSYPLNDVER